MHLLVRFERLSRAFLQIHGVKSDMNYVRYNAIINILSRPPAPKKEKNFLKKNGYGEVPFYLKEIKSQIEAEYDFVRSLRHSSHVSSPIFPFFLLFRPFFPFYILYLIICILYFSINLFISNFTRSEVASCIRPQCMYTPAIRRGVTSRRNARRFAAK